MAYVVRLTPVSTNADLVLPFRIRDRNTGNPIDLTGVALTINVYDEAEDNERGCKRFTATNAAGGAITFGDPGVFILTYLATASTPFKSLCGGNYILQVIASLGGSTTEVIRAILPVLGTR